MRICSIAWHISTHSSGERQNYSDPLYELALSRPCILRRLRPATGFEPGTSRMRVSCVTTEPPRSVNIYIMDLCDLI